MAMTTWRKWSKTNLPGARRTALRRNDRAHAGHGVTGCESIGVVTEYRFSEMETRSMDRSAFKMGSYGAGALWCLKEREGKYITFNNLRIARQEKDGTWMAVEPGWTVTKTGPVDVRVQHDGREGVVLPFRARNARMMPAKGASSRPTASISDQAHCLKLEFPRKPSSLHDSPPVP